MKLKQVSIHNFRSIHDETFSLLEYSLLVGGNNAGKTAIVDSIRCFYEKDGYKFKKERDWCRMSPVDDESWIDLAFELTQDEWDLLPPYCKLAGLQLKVRKFFLTSEKDTSGNKRQDSIYAFLPDGTINGEPFYGAKSVQLGKFGKLVYIPAVSNIDDHTKLSGPSALRDLLNDVLEDVIKSSRSYQDFETSFTDFSGAIKNDQSVDGRSISGLEDALNLRIQSWGTRFNLKITPPSTATIVKSLIEQEFEDATHGGTQNASEYGSGFQRQFIFAVIAVAAQYIAPRSTKKADFAPDYTLILFEEPEAFLHPPQQDSLSGGLQKLSLNIGTQVLCSTHSSHFVSKNTRELKGLIKLNKEAGLTHIRQIDDPTWDAIVDANQAIAEVAQQYPSLVDILRDDNLLAEMDAVRYFLWLDPERSSIFFAKHVLLVEGATDRVLVSRLLSENKLNCSDGDLTIVDTLGKYNTHRFMALLNAFGIKHSVLVDDDHNRNHHRELNLLIQRAEGQSTHAIRFIPGDIEELLDIKDLTRKTIGLRAVFPDLISSPEQF